MTQAWPDGVITLTIPPLKKRRITLQHEDGTPYNGVEVPTAVYLWSRNHCGVHRGFELGTFTTDETGSFDVVAPNSALYLDLQWYRGPRTNWTARAGQSARARPIWDLSQGVKTGSKDVEVVRHKWVVEPRRVSVSVRNQLGRPLAGVTFVQWQSAAICGAYRAHLGQTDENGEASLLVTTETTLEIQVKASPEGEDLSVLSEEQVEQLFAEGHIDLTLDPP